MFRLFDILRVRKFLVAIVILTCVITLGRYFRPHSNLQVYYKGYNFLTQRSDTKLADQSNNGQDSGNKKIFFSSQPLVIWSNDFHIGPINDLKHILTPLGVAFIDKSLSGHCHLTHTCANNLRVINRGNGIGLNPDLIPKFHSAYKDDPEMQRVDAYVCFHPSSMCDLFIPFNKSLIVIASTRYEMGRHSPAQWKQWNENLIKISLDPKSFVAANNLYDAEYIRYFTGINVTVLESFCDYGNASFEPTRPGFLLAPIHQGGYSGVFMAAFEEAKKKSGSLVELKNLRSIYPHYKYSDLTAHQGIVYVPYQVSVMSLFEQYRMNIPLFFPSRNFMTELQFKYHVMNERTWAMVWGQVPKGSTIPGILMGVPDPNNETDKEAIRYWLGFSDFYRWPYITYYDSYEDLVVKLTATDLKEISAKMAVYNKEHKERLLLKWSAILKTIANLSSNHPH